MKRLVLIYLILAIVSSLLLVPTNVSAIEFPTVVATIPIGGSPRGVAVNPDMNMVYVANYYGDNLSVIDGATNAIVGDIHLGPQPSAVAVNAVTNRIYVTSHGWDSDPGFLWVIDGATNSIISTLSINGGGAGLAINEVTNRIYVTNSTSDIWMIDRATNTVIDIFDVWRSGDMNSLAVDASRNLIYGTSFTNHYMLSVIDGLTNIITDTVIVGDWPDAVAVNSFTNLIYVGSVDGWDIRVIDGYTHSVIKTTDIGAPVSRVGVDHTTSRVYAGDHNGRVSVMDGSGNNITTLNVCGFVSGMAVNSLTHRIYVTNGAGLVSVIQDSPPASITTSSGSGFYQGDFSSAWYSRIRHGGAGGFRAKLVDQELFTGGTVPWTNGSSMHLKLFYDAGTGNATMTITGCLQQFDPVVMTSPVPGANGKLLITAKTSPEAEGRVIVSNVMVDGNPVGLVSGITATGSAGTRDVKYLLLDSIYGSFVFECDCYFIWGSNPRDEGPALQVDIENSTPLPITPAWDLNGDHVCDIFDLVMMGNRYSETGTPGWIAEDIIINGVIDIFDLVELGNHYGETW